MNRILLLICFAVVCATPLASQAQNDPFAQSFERIHTVQEEQGNNTLFNNGMPNQLAKKSKMLPALQTIQNEDTSDEEKTEAKATVREALEKEYDSFIERNESQLEKMRARLAKLEEQLEKRKDAKDKLVELKLEMLISQAEGIGWPEQGGNFSFPGQNYVAPRFQNPAPTSLPQTPAFPEQMVPRTQWRPEQTRARVPVPREPVNGFDDPRGFANPPQAPRLNRRNDRNELNEPEQLPPGFANVGNVQGVVRKVVDDFVAISVGSEDGMEIGHQLKVYRNDKWVAQIKLVQVDRNLSSGEVIHTPNKDESVEKGDQVSIADKYIE